MRTCVLLVSLLMAVPAAASPVVWTVQGFVTDVQPESQLTGVFPVGESFSVELVADPAAVDLCDSPSSGLYETPGATVHVGNQSWTASATFWEVNNQDGSCVVPSPWVAVRSFFLDAPFTAFVLGWGNTTSEAFPSGLEPGFAWFAGPAGPEVFADMEPGGAAVPEPATWLLVAVGLGLGRKRPRW